MALVQEPIKVIQTAKELADVHNDFITGKFKEASNKIDSIERNYISKQHNENQLNVYRGIYLPKDMIDSMAAAIEKYSNDNQKQASEITKYVIGDTYRESEDPDEITAVLENKVKFYNVQMQIYKAMIQVNYNILSITRGQIVASEDYTEPQNESVDISDIEEDYNAIYRNINETMNHISYVESINNNNSTILLYEGKVSNMLNRFLKILKLIKKVISFLIKLVSGILKFINAVVNRIKAIINAFRKGKTKAKKFGKKMTTSVLVSESAKIVTYDATDWDQIEKQVVGSCSKITNKIKQVEKSQTDALQKLEKFCEDKINSMNETSNVYSLEELIKLI